METGNGIAVGAGFLGGSYMLVSGDTTAGNTLIAIALFCWVVLNTWRS